jgi:hypothetical protein
VDGVQDKGSEDTTINIDRENLGGLLDINNANVFRLGHYLLNCKRIITSKILSSRLMEFYCTMFCGNMGYQPKN